MEAQKEDSLTKIRRPNYFWSEEEKQALHEVVCRGWTQEAIAAQLTEDFGFTVTVGAVAGCISRMGLRKALEND